ncbi:hypothetical protein CCACVL1_12395 [Corchorus capsularis]|uniref:Uncharacterized protein n=1 Tax=Corchorus capsularis TaxID=210143 RepID=A0A1R3IFY7_COCAP|nr:hypothetical protein CCACVL1_12395 [Corchorus capsularis]
MGAAAECLFTGGRVVETLITCEDPLRRRQSGSS